ncbi:MAG: glucokinase [Nitrospirales bacterium]|nr:MAG: glucokinase [Nitrospirales bacterium]
MILAGDIGGTNARLGLFELADDRIKPVVVKNYPSRDYTSLHEIVAQFIKEQSLPIKNACFAIAGPVHEGRVATTNLAWLVDAQKLANLLNVKQVGLINDLEAIGYGLTELTNSDLATLNIGNASSVGNIAIVAAGTGLGEAACFWDGQEHQPFASEGGHADFAPRNPTEMELLTYLLTDFDRVSYERLLSGSGLFEIYKFHQHTHRGEERPELTEVLYQQAHPASVVQAALENRSEVCTNALNLFVSLYGAEAGNLALKVMARGGVFIGGGIAPKIIQKLKEPIFMSAFTQKGRMRPLLAAMPVHVILNDKTGLLGAARYAVHRVARRNNHLG